MTQDPEIAGRYTYLTIEDVEYRVYYEESGQGIPVICQHTAGSDGRQYRHLLEDVELASRFRFIAPDLPYHGRSLPPSSIRWWEQEYKLTKHFFERFIVELSHKLELDQPVFMGCSMGGHLAPDLALDYPEEFRAVVGLEATKESHGVDGLLEYLYHPRISNESKGAQMLGICAPTSPEESRHETAWVYMQGAPPVFRGDLFYYMIEHDLTDGKAGQIDTSKVGVYILAGEYDYSGSPEFASEMSKEIAGSKYVEMPGMGHFPMSENYPLFKEYMLPVFDDIASK